MEKKFDFTHFQKVLVRDEEYDEWQCDFYSTYKSSEALPYICVGNKWKYCIPYEGNEHLCDTTDPYVQPYEPKDGDFVYYRYDDEFHISICKNGEKNLVYAQLNFKTSEISFNDELLANFDFRREATKVEKQLLLSKLHAQGKDWCEEKKKIVNWKWEPSEGECFYYPIFRNCEFVSISGVWENEDKDSLSLLSKGYVFRTEKECQAMCDKLNDAIKNVK